MRAPAGAWGLVVVAARTTDAAGAPLRFIGDAPAPDPAHTDTADLLAGVWLSEPPHATLYAGDVVVRLYASTADPADPAVTDVEVLAAVEGEWRTVGTREAVDARWPHAVAMTALLYMRYLADAALQDAQWATLTGPIAAAMPDWLSSDLGIAGQAGSAPGRVPDGLAELVDAGLVEVGEQVMLDAHTATIGAGGVLHQGPDVFDVSTVNALATHLCGYTANGWHLWRRARDNRLLADLRTDLALR
jgi:hypothetical protein